VTELERFFRRLVANLDATDPARLHQPIPLEEIHGSIVPYRSNRRALGLESSEDYELVLLRLCAGEGGLVRTEPEEVRAQFAEELRSPNPDLSILHRSGPVLVFLRAEPLARARAPLPDPHLPYAPPGPPPAGVIAEPALDLPAPPPPPPDAPDAPDPYDEETPEELASGGPRCLYCGGSLPTDRPARFCPHCGQRQAPPECPRCHSEVEAGWRHCVNCGAALGGG
jgi:hypothetical protein